MKLATRSWGEEGRPLAVLVHGVTASSRTWWRVGPWFEENGWYAVAVDLRGHGASPRMSGDEELGDLVEDLRETIAGLLAPGETCDVLLGHSLGALTSLELCTRDSDLVARLVLEEPPGSRDADFDEVARMIKEVVARARKDPDAAERQQLEENPSWSEGDAASNVASQRECDAEPVAAMMRNLRFDLTDLVKSLEIPALLVLGSEAQGSALPEPGRTSVREALPENALETFDTGHGVHRDDFEGYVRLLGRWLGA